MPNSTEGRCNGGPAAADGCASALPSNPFYMPRYHFGMLLGVDDFETEQAYHRGKMRLHNAWLHGEGVVWGFRVDAPPREGGPGLRGELRVLPGFALDAAGRELHLDATACVSVAAWYEARRDDPDHREYFETAENGTVTFAGYVSACFRACLTRPVPAISEPCAGATGDTAYSRAHETVELRLVPGPLPERAYPYPRLRLLFGLTGPRLDRRGDPLPEDREIVQERERIRTLDEDARPPEWLAVFRRLAALDEMDLGPAETPEVGGATLFPAPDDTCVVLARVAITLRARDGGFELASAEVDNTVRPTHVATSTIQELLRGPVPVPASPEPGSEEEEAGGGGGGIGELAPPPSAPPATGAADAGGPRIDPASVRLEGEAVTFTATHRLSRASVQARAFSVSSYDNRDGWHNLEIRNASVDGTGKRVRLDLYTGFGGNRVRIIARGTGSTPLLGSSGVPLAGAVGGPPGSAHDGNDFVLMLKRSET